MRRVRPVTDHKPPRLAGDDRSTVLALLQYQRDSFVRKLQGVADDSAQVPAVVSGTSLMWLAVHMARAEQIWVVQRFAGADLPDDLAADPTTLTEAIAAYRRTQALVDGIVAAASLDDRCHDAEPPVNLRWILIHLLEETARHAGHADILRELIDGATGR
jgi:hypothetical protein